MKLKKMIAIALSAALLCSSVSLVASADDQTAKSKTYNYVALGDSISSGYGLSSSDGTIPLATDPALILSESLIADPIKDAYPAVFGTFLEKLGQDKGYNTTATNLALTAYRAQDVEQTILTEGYKGDIAYFAASARKLLALPADAHILIAEACTHRPLTEDIGRVKLPRPSAF